MQSSCVHWFVRGSYDQTSLNHVRPFVPPNLRVHSQRVSHAAGHRDTNVNIQIEFVCPGDDCVVSSACGDIRTTFHSGDKNFPTRADALEGVEVEGHEVVEKEAINLASEYVEL